MYNIMTNKYNWNNKLSAERQMKYRQRMTDDQKEVQDKGS